MLDHSSENLSRAILQTIAYSDVFDYPLNARELHRYLTGVKASLEEVVRAVREEGVVTRTGDYFTLPGREEIVNIRMRREAHSRELMSRAIQYGRILGTLPYVRMVALTGSLAVMNILGNHDFDYMLVTQTSRLWVARAFAVTFGRIMRPFGHRICVNLLLSENALDWHQHDLYSAREICQMIPVVGMDVYRRFRARNAWTESVLPNSSLSTPDLVQVCAPSRTNVIQRLIEVPLDSERLEQWAMKFQLHHIAQSWGTGDETIFSANVCQSNFHNHRKWTQVVFENKLSALTAVPGSALEDVAPRTPPGACRK